MSHAAMDRPRIGCIDVLADALGASRSDDIAAVMVRASDPWGFELDATRSALVAVIQGGCYLHQPASRPARLDAGDLALVPTPLPRSGLASSAEGQLTVYDDAIFSSTQTTIHLDGADATSSLLYVAYECTSLERLVTASLPTVVRIDGNSHAQNEPLAQTIQLLCVELGHDRPGARTAIRRLVDLVVVHLLRAWMVSDHPNGPCNALAAPGDTAIARAIDRIHAESTRRWTVGSLATEIGLSRAAFVRRFVATVGEPPSRYLTRWRLATAARLLRETSDPLVAIAREVGYSSEFTFSRAFRRAYGQPPGRYRAEARR